ncbi:MAG: hypothetical protein J6K36_03095 [Bacilli bacterium]|nr:hypothetical protein [Bacilli bacterium]
MKRNYYIFIIIFLVVLFRTSILNLFMNVKKMFTSAEPNIEIFTLKEENRRLKDEYTSLLDFKSRINIDEDYTITNVHKSNYGFDKIVLNGSFKENSEIVSDDGLVGIITKSDNNLSYGDYLFNTHILVRIDDTEGKIYGRDDDGNLLIKEISNYNNIKINDNVSSMHGMCIGKVVNIIYEDLESIIVVKMGSVNNLNYVGVIER